MPILVECPLCQHRSRAGDEVAGELLPCSQCGTVFPVQGRSVASHDVFISHASQNAPMAQRVCEALEREGLRCWMAPRNIPPGATWSSSIVEALEASGAVLLIYSAPANLSPHVLREVEIASSRKVPVVPMRIEDVPMSNDLKFFLGLSQWYDAFTTPIDAHIAPLVTALRRLLHYPPRSGPAIVVPQSSLPAEPRLPSSSPLKVPPFHFGGVVPPEYFVGRIDELQRAERAVCSQNNMLLVGELRSGKTSFGKMLIHRIMGREANDVLGVYINVQTWPKLTIESFLGHTIISLLGEISRQVFGVKFMSVTAADPFAKREDLRGDPAFGSFLEVCKFIKSRTGLKEADSEPFQTEEFVHVHSELMEVLRARGWNNCFVFYDEANRLPRELSVDLLLSHQESLTAAGLTSIYAASPALLDLHSPLRDWFAEYVRLGPFCGHSEMKSLLSRYYFGNATADSEVPVRSEALDRLWQLSRGMPFLIQLIAGRSFDLAHRHGANELREEHVSEAYQTLQKEKPTVFGPAGE